MNFQPLAPYYPKLSALGEHCEDLIRDRHYRESVQGMRQFAEGVLKTVFRVQDDDEGLGALMRRDDFAIVVPRKTAASFSLLQRYGNKASHFQVNDLPVSVPYERHYEIRTKEDAETCLRHGYDIARWLLSCRDPSAPYPDFQPLETVRTNAKGEKRKIVFDRHQEEAIGLQSGRHLVLAPPGCGKTEILTERVRRALESGVALTDMLCLTFTNRAARGMQERIVENFPERSMGELYVGNLHRFCSKLLFESEAVPETATILDEDDAREVIDSLARERLLEDRPPASEGLPLPEDPLPGFVADFIQQRAAELLQKDRGFHEDTIQEAHAPEVNQKNFELFAAFGLVAYDENRNPKMDEDRVATIARDYLAYKESQELLDFNDLLLKAWLFLTDKRSFVKRYPWIQVDEVQDLSPLQLAIVEKLWNDKEPSSVCVYFGDEQQAIFSFMGAKLDRLQALSRTHAVHHLHRNFRSPSYLLDLFNQFAVRELDADPALLPRADKITPKPKGALRLLAACDAKDQIELLSELALRAPEGETTAVLVPSNAMADTQSDRLKEKKVEHFKISGSDLFRMNVLKTAKAYLGILKDDFQTAPWAQLISRLTRKDTTLKRIRDYLARKFPDYGLLPSDLLHYSAENPEEPMSLLDDFTRAYWGELVVFDTETTGLEVGLDDVIQIAARKLRGGRCVEKLELFLKTEREIPKMLGNIPNPMAEVYEAEKARGSLLPPVLAFKKFLAFVGDAPVVGHNVEYDVNIVNAQYAVLKDRMKKAFDDDVDVSALPRAYARGELMKRYDTLRLSYALERVICREKGLKRLPSHKLRDLIRILGVEGVNSHKADDDVAATEGLLAHFYELARPLVEKQRKFLLRPSIRNMSQTLRNALSEIYEEHRNLSYRPQSPEDPAILVQVLREFIESLPNHTEVQDQIDEIRKKLPLLYAYLDRVLIEKEKSRTLYSQLQRYLVHINSLKEADLCSSDVVRDRVFLSTVHKAKGLEFENVVIADARDGVYPFFKSSTPEAKEEDARKFYVALSRAKKTITITWPLENDWGYSCRESPFLAAIREDFVRVTESNVLRDDGVREPPDRFENPDEDDSPF